MIRSASVMLAAAAAASISTTAATAGTSGCANAAAGNCRSIISASGSENSGVAALGWEVHQGHGAPGAGDVLVAAPDRAGNTAADFAVLPGPHGTRIFRWDPDGHLSSLCAAVNVIGPYSWHGARVGEYAIVLAGCDGQADTGEQFILSRQDDGDDTILAVRTGREVRVTGAVQQLTTAAPTVHAIGGEEFREVG